MEKASNKVSVYATPYNAETSNEVALPNKYLKFAARGWKIPTDLQKYYNKTFSVNLTKDSKTLNGVPVNEVGPWNKNDNYWDTSVDNNTRRKFIDLAQYTPEARSAYYSDYNNGKDEFERDVLNSTSIDLSRTVAKNLGGIRGADGIMWICQVCHKTIKRICLILVGVCIVISFLAICRQYGRSSINISFPEYTEHELDELRNGHHTGYFDKEDVLFTFLGKYNDGDFGDNPRLQYVDYSNITEKASAKDGALNGAVFDAPCEG